MVGVPADLGVGGPGAAVGQLAGGGQLVVGDRLGHGNVAVEQHPQLVAGVQVGRVEGLDVEPRVLSPAALAAATSWRMASGLPSAYRVSARNPCTRALRMR